MKKIFFCALGGIRTPTTVGALTLLCSVPVAAQSALGYCLSFGANVSPISTTEYVDIPVTFYTDYSGGGTQPLSITAQGSDIDVIVHAKGSGEECQIPPPLASRETVAINLPGRAAGAYRINLRFPNRVVSQARDLNVLRSGVTAITAESLIFGQTQRYFLTASNADLPTLGITGGPYFSYASGGTWPLWAKADSGFKVWPATGVAPAAAKPVCRFFNSRVATHFYSARQADCDALRGVTDWVDEGVAFRILLPQNGACQSGTDPVYRLFNASLANHRYTREPDSYVAMINKGWAGEGVVFCAPLN